MIVFASILGFLLVILLIRLSVAAQYGEEGLLVRVWFGPLGISVFPREEKKPKREKKKREKPEKKEKADRGGTVAQLRAGLSVVGPIFEQIRKRLVIRELTLHYTAAGDDAAMTALAYGGAHAAVSAILPLLRYNFRVKEQDIQIHVNFEQEEDLIFTRVKLSISLGALLYLGLFALYMLWKSGLIGASKTPAATS